jgi:hypothetical protein
MRIDKSIAEDMVQESLQAGLIVQEERTIENSSCVVIFAESINYLETHDDRYKVIGMAGILIEKATGRRIELASCYTIDQNLEIFSEGCFLYDKWSIRVEKINNLSESIAQLNNLKVFDANKLEDYLNINEIFYTENEITNKLKYLPAVFDLGDIYLRWYEIKKIRKKGCFDFKLIET